MNEKEYQQNKTFFWNTPWTEHPTEATNWILNEIGYQLTRIADVTEMWRDFRPELINHDKPAPGDELIEIPDDKGRVHCFHRRDLANYRDGYFQYEPQGGFYTALSAKEIKAIIEPISPPPEALVEAVIEVLKDAHNCLVLHGHIDKDTPLHKRLDSALTIYLAAHEKAVR